MTDMGEKRKALRRNRSFATLLLIFAAVIFVATRAVPEPGFYVQLIGTAAEAAIIGGLADWFAVTALFRHPLGIPIPHTALIPSRKDEIALSFGNFIRDRFLDPALLTSRLRRENRALELAEWLDSPSTANFLAERLVEFLPHLLNGTKDAEVQNFMRKLFQEGVRRADLAGTADQILQHYVEDGRHMDIVDALAATLKPSLRALKQPIIEKIGEQTGRFFPSYFDRKVGKGLLDGAQQWLEAVQDTESDDRRQLDEWIRERFAEFRVSPDYAALLKDAQKALVSNPALLHSLGATWDDIKRALLDDNASPAPRTGVVIAGIVRAAGRLLKDSPTMQVYLNQAIERVVVDYIAPWRVQIGSYIVDVVQSWDGPQIAETIELQVGSDLQYIRINGTVVGALIGSALFLLGAGFPLLFP